MTQDMMWTAYTDGACAPSNPGPAGWGWYVDDTCWAAEAGGPGVEACEDGEPMHVCAPGDAGDLPRGTEAAVDSFLNTCNWINCGFVAYPPNEYFGGCSGNGSAGTACCR